MRAPLPTITHSMICGSGSGFPPPSDELVSRLAPPAPAVVVPPLPVMSGSTTALHTCPLCFPVKTCVGDASFLAHLNGSSHRKQVALGPRVDIRDDVCDLHFAYLPEFLGHRDSESHIRMSAFILGVELDFCIACHHCFTSSVAAHIAGKRHTAHMIGRAELYVDGHPWVRVCSGLALPRTDAMRSQLATPAQLRALFPPVMAEEYKEMEMENDEVSELDDAGELRYDDDGGVSILVYDDEGRGHFEPLETPK